MNTTLSFTKYQESDLVPLTRIFRSASTRFTYTRGVGHRTQSTQRKINYSLSSDNLLTRQHQLILPPCHLYPRHSPEAIKKPHTGNDFWSQATGMKFRLTDLVEKAALLPYLCELLFCSLTPTLHQR